MICAFYFYPLYKKFKHTNLLSLCILNDKTRICFDLSNRLTSIRNESKKRIITNSILCQSTFDFFININIS